MRMTLRGSCVMVTLGLSLTAMAQVPDLLNAFEAGGRAMATGGGSAVTDASSLSSLENPAGLAYLRGKSVAVSFRNLPTSTTRTSGNFNDRTNSTEQGAGRFGLSHIGYATPYGKGVVGVSYTIGGYLKNTTTGTNLQNGTLSVRGLAEVTEAQTNFFTASYAWRQRDLNLGAGLVFASQYARASQRYALFDAGNNQVGTTESNISGNGYGFGLVVGVQGTTGGENPLAWGFSLRTPIELQGNGDSAAVYDRIPGQASVGLAGRLPFGQGEEFASWAAQLSYHFGGDDNAIIARKNMVSFGFGVEYNFSRFNAIWPVRLGLAVVPSGGNGFDDRNAFTFGFGYRPKGRDYSIDLSFARPSGGGPYDIALGFTYRK